MIKIIDCGSQYTQNIARRVRELNVYSEIVPFHTHIDEIKKDAEGIIISGGQFSVYDEGAPLYDKKIFDTGIPILGICYGQQSIAYLLGGVVKPTKNREYGETKVTLSRESLLFHDVPNEITVWMSHGDIVEIIPDGYEVLAKSENGHITSFQNSNRGIYAVQFHPEVDHTEQGRKILDNYINICKAQRTWKAEEDYERIVKEISEKIKGKKGIGGISGGVDSTTASVLIKKIAGDNFIPIFVDNGLLRLNEVNEVKDLLSNVIDIHFVDSSQRFLEKLQGIVNPDEKRKIIGNEFIEVFEETSKKISPQASYLVQGTLYPDVIESVPVYGSSSKIKRHHNVGGLPEKMNYEVIEPFRNLFKDEVRKIAEQKLGLPKEIVWRHPFPGPGLAVRIVGQEITKEKLEVLKKADAIFLEELKRRNLYYKISQAFAGILSKSVGVMGDEGVYQYEIGLRAVVTKDFMTSDFYRFDWKDLQEISSRIINEVKGVSGVNYKTTQKPPGTIEWE